MGRSKVRSGAKISEQYMKTSQLIRYIFLGLFALLAQSAFANPCPDGNFNPQSRVCMCPGGGYVAPGNWCEVKILPVPETWGAIAIDTSPQQTKAVYRSSTKSQAEASKKALAACGLSTCQVVLEYKNACGAVAADGKGIWGAGVDLYEQPAIQKAADNCYAKGATVCYHWIDASCAAAPR